MEKLAKLLQPICECCEHAQIYFESSVNNEHYRVLARNLLANGDNTRGRYETSSLHIAIEMLSGKPG